MTDVAFFIVIFVPTWLLLGWFSRNKHRRDAVWWATVPMQNNYTAEWVAYHEHLTRAWWMWPFVRMPRRPAS